MKFSQIGCALSAKADEVVAFYTGHFNGNLNYFATDSGELLRECAPTIQNYELRSTLTADGRDVVSFGINGEIRWLDAATGALKRETLRPIGAGRPSPNGQLLEQGDYNRPGLMLRIIDAQTGAIQHEVQQGEAQVTNVAWSPDGKWLATGATDKLVRIWNAATGKIEHELAGHTGTIWSLAWSADGERLASSAEDNSVRIWAPHPGELIVAYDQFPQKLMWAPEGSNEGLTWSPDNRRLWYARL